MTSPHQDGNSNRNDVYFQYAGAPLQEAPTLNHLIQQGTQLYANANDGNYPIHQVPPNPILWQNPLMGPPFIQPAFLQNQPQHQQQQQHYNDYIYNLHMQQTLPMPQAAQQETYSVLPVGYGNFLKIYHCNENGETPMPNEPLGQQNFPPRHQTHQPGTNFHVNQQNNQQVQQQYFNNYELFSSSGTLLNPRDINITSSLNVSNPISPATSTPPIQSVKPTPSKTQPVIRDQETLNTTNFIINNLVNNWSPNLTGDSYMNMNGNPAAETGDRISQKTEEVIDLVATSNEEKTAEPEKYLSDLHSIPIATAPINETQKQITNDHKRIIKNIESTPVETKKRIVAEVKPMRMTYSDVLSKVNGKQDANSPRSTSKPSSINSIKTPTANISQNEKKLDKTPQRYYDNESNVQKTYAKKSPSHDSKEPQQSVSQVKRRSKSGNNSYQQSANTTGIKNVTQFSKSYQNNNSSSGSDTKPDTRNSSKSNDRNSDSNPNSSRSPMKNTHPEDKDFNGFYNVTEKNNSHSKTDFSATNTSATSGPANGRKASKTAGNNAASQNNNHQSRNRYSNNNISYYYSSKRSNRSSNSSNNGGLNSSRNYELAKKILRTWVSYMLRALVWFYYLIYDIIVLSCTILYDRLTYACINGFEYSKQFIKDLRTNSNRPGLWMKGYWRRFDARFAKGSKWAIWRKIFEKPPEPAPENYKSGRLPSTGEEAMYSLLNCKGKDAYSILGVPPNCPQEQIRKHYKKIAVLVHPDKNKQAGAEEAFKVLQRAFELIGEPETRLTYDQSLVEALQAEKAWSELHVLLSQLQTKISEAANTIRCSTCALRHPRKLVDRPTYAARQCNACKTQHSAKEGDIWAETYCFGMRWKYLALMEGKVFDVTQWAFCQKGALAQLEPNSHLVQYRIVRGAQQQQEQQQQQQQKQSKRNNMKNQRTEFPTGKAPWEHGSFKHDMPPSDATFEDFLDNLYGGQKPNQKQNSASFGSTRRRSRRN